MMQQHFINVKISVFFFFLRTEVKELLHKYISYFILLHFTYTYIFCFFFYIFQFVTYSPVQYSNINSSLLMFILSYLAHVICAHLQPSGHSMALDWAESCNPRYISFLPSHALRIFTFITFCFFSFDITN